MQAKRDSAAVGRDVWLDAVNAAAGVAKVCMRWRGVMHGSRASASRVQDAQQQPWFPFLPKKGFVVKYQCRHYF